MSAQEKTIDNTTNKFKVFSIVALGLASISVVFTAGIAFASPGSHEPRMEHSQVEKMDEHGPKQHGMNENQSHEMNKSKESPSEENDGKKMMNKERMQHEKPAEK